MTNEQAVNMLNAKLECLNLETSGTDFCNHTNCYDCSLSYEQGNIGEQKEALVMAIKALEKEPCEDCISREQAIKATYGFERYTGIDEAPYEYTESILRELPPVTPTHIDLDGLKSDMKALNCGYPYGLDYLLDCLKKRLGITIAGAESESE